MKLYTDSCERKVKKKRNPSKGSSYLIYLSTWNTSNPISSILSFICCSSTLSSKVISPLFLGKLILMSSTPSIFIILSWNSRIWFSACIPWIQKFNFIETPPLWFFSRGRAFSFLKIILGNLLKNDKLVSLFCHRGRVELLQR